MSLAVGQNTILVSVFCDEVSDWLPAFAKRFLSLAWVAFSSVLDGSSSITLLSQLMG